MQIVVVNLKYVLREEVFFDVIEKEKVILRQQVLNEGKLENVVDRIVEGRFEKFFEEVCLFEQFWIKNFDMKIKDLFIEKIVKIGENIVIRRFVRFERGEGIEKVVFC